MSRERLAVLVRADIPTHPPTTPMRAYGIRLPIRFSRRVPVRGLSNLKRHPVGGWGSNASCVQRR